MKVFLSYRRDDTGGRAGRLFDTLVAQYGARDVFQDVSAVEPGVDFTARLDAAIAASDVVLVVIGPGWLSAASADGGRRVDRADDLVRREVSAALASSIRVVPVLVDGARLPDAADLPDELRPLVGRQAADLRDVSWHEDVANLLRRLEREDRIPGGRGRRRTLAIVAGAAVLVVGAAVVLAVSRDDDDDASDDAEPSSCEPMDASWTDVPVSEGAETTVSGSEVQAVRFTVDTARYRSSPSDGHVVVVMVTAANESEPLQDSSDNDVYNSIALFEGLLVDGVGMTEIVCARVIGEPNLEPNESGVAEVGFRSDVDPAGASLALETVDGGLVPIVESS